MNGNDVVDMAADKLETVAVADDEIVELTALQLSLVGGGDANVVFL